LNRLESGATPDRYKKIACRPERIDELLVDLFVESFPEAPVEIVLDLDTTDLELHGGQEGRFFHGYYDEYCYLPLYIFCGEHRRLGRQPRGGRAHRRADPHAVAAYAGDPARRLRLLPRRADDVV